LPWVYAFIIMVISSIFLLLLVIYIWRSGIIIGSKAITLLLFGIALYSSGVAFELIIPSLGGKNICLDFVYAGLVLIGPCWLAFSLAYSGKSLFLNKWVIGSLSIIPVVSLILKCTDGLFKLVYKESFIDPSNPYPVVSFIPGPWYSVQTVFQTTCMISGIILVAIVIFRSTAIYRRQAWVLFIASIIPLIGFILYLSGFIFKGFDYNPMFLSITGPLLVIGLIRYRLLYSLPLTWENVLETVTNHMIILDNEGLVVDFNPGIKSVFKDLTGKSIGKLLTEVIHGFPEILKLAESPDRYQAVIRIHGSRVLKFQVFYIRDSVNNVTGKTIILNESHKKYGKHHLDDDSIVRDILKIEKIMAKEKPFLDPELNLTVLAGKLEITRNRLSMILNECKKQKFYDFINNFRIDEAKRLMASKSCSGNILQIAFDSGFNSKSAFYSAFKGITGTTPLDYLSGLKKSGEVQ